VLCALPHAAHDQPTIVADKNAAYPKAAAEMKKDGEPWPGIRLHQLRYWSNIVTQDQRSVK
jgi:transposase, IS6 family